MAVHRRDRKGGHAGWGPDGAERDGLARRYDELIAAAKGDRPLRAFWSAGKLVFQEYARGPAAGWPTTPLDRRG